MSISHELEKQIFKYNFLGNTFVCDCAINKPDIAGKVFELMAKDKRKPGESDYMQFKRLYEIMVKDIARNTKAQKQAEDSAQWKQEYKAQFRGAITPERVKQMLDEQLDKGEISERQHHFGYLGLKEIWGYVPEEAQELEESLPF